MMRLGVLFASLLALAMPTTVRAAEVTVFAAASLKSSLDAIARDWEQETGHRVLLSYAGTSVLARQIQQGAEADLFMSANPEWMDVIDVDGLVEAGTRRDLLRNTLVLVAHDPPELAVDVLLTAEHVRTLIAAETAPWLAMAFVDAVPAGLYGKAALESFGLWSMVEPGVVQAENVRAALTFVERGEVPYGIVYGTDAAASTKVTVVGTFPAETHPPIVYPMAVLTDASDAGRAFHSHLGGAEARAVFEAAGFQTAD